MPRWGIALLLSFVARILSAQTLTGTVRDSASREPIPGAVILLLADTTTVARAITNELGRYRIARPASASRMRVVRIGFRPRAIDLRQVPSETIDVDMPSITTMLEPVQVTAAAGCPRRSDRNMAFALLEQARAGLLTTVVARETDPASMVRMSFERFMDSNDRVVRQTVHVDSSDGVNASFEAARSASEFVKRGFVSDSAGLAIFYGPDADVLLDDAFVAGYCFHLGDADPARPHQVALVFNAADQKKGRIDIEGTLWVDTAARALRDLNFQYRGMDRDVSAIHPGGRTSFREMTNGTVLIDRWVLRLPAARRNEEGRQMRGVRYDATETGGEVARASWPTGELWFAKLGALQAKVVDSAGAPVTNAVVQLDGTNYSARPDSAGVATFDALLPGPYFVMVVDSAVASVGMSIRSSAPLVAARDSTVHASIVIPKAGQYAGAGCVANALTDEAAPWLLIRVNNPNDRPARNAHWRLSRSLRGGSEAVEQGRADADGVVHYCMKMARDDIVLITAWRDRQSVNSSLEREISRRGTIVTLVLPPPN
ncbi:MAG: carboxypeptidase-like regulatory domain-containing protein [Gemmatimonadaceae bacterium]